MSMIRITKKFDFETGHALYGYDGKCKNIHGHSYKLFVTVQGTPITDTTHVKYGMVIDFTDLKKIVKEEIVDKFDHATVFNKNISNRLPENISLLSIKLQETESSFAEWYASEN